MDRGAWKATVHRVAQSWTRLKRLTHTLECEDTVIFIVPILLMKKFEA